MCLSNEEGEHKVSVIEDSIELIDFGPRYVHSQSTFVVPETPDDEQSVAASEPPSDCESVELGPSDSDQEECVRRTAGLKTLTLGKVTSNKSGCSTHNGQDKLLQKHTTMLKSTTAIAAEGENRDLQFSPLVVSEGSTDGLGLTEAEMVHQLTLNTCKTPDIVATSQQIQAQFTTGVVLPADGPVVATEPISLCNKGSQRELPHSNKKSTSSFSMGSRKSSSILRSSNRKLVKIWPASATGRVSLHEMKKLARSRGVRFGKSKSSEFSSHPTNCSLASSSPKEGHGKDVSKVLSTSASSKSVGSQGSLNHRIGEAVGFIYPSARLEHSCSGQVGDNVSYQ